MRGVLRETLTMGLGVLLCVSGCASGRAAHRGDEAMARRDYQSAVQSYAEANYLAPRNSTYRRLLKNAQLERGRERLRLAEEMRRNGQLGSAIELCDSVLKDLPSHLPAIRLRDRLAEQKQDLEAQLMAAWADLNAGQDPQQVAERLKLLLWLNPTDPRIEEYLQLAQQRMKSP